LTLHFDDWGIRDLDLDEGVAWLDLAVIDIAVHDNPGASGERVFLVLQPWAEIGTGWISYREAEEAGLIQNLIYRLGSLNADTMLAATEAASIDKPSLLGLRAFRLWTKGD
jgi:hypothetical protein